MDCYCLDVNRRNPTVLIPLRAYCPVDYHQAGRLQMCSSNVLMPRRAYCHMDTRGMSFGPLKREGVNTPKDKVSMPNT